MSMWKTIFTIVVFVFLMVMIQAVAGPALESTGEGIKESQDLETKYWDGNQLIDGMISSFFDGIMVAIFGIFVWGISRAIRRERFLR